MEKIELKYRTWFKGIKPEVTKVAVPGWAGSDKQYENGAMAQPWHCLPFIEGACHGLELIYPFDAEARVTYDGKNFKFEGDFQNENPWDPGSSPSTPPFSNFAHGHYGFTSSLDLMPPEGYVIRTEPHPRYYTDQTGTVPIMIPAHIQSWWPKIFFVVFKAPSIGQTHIFRKGEPYGQILVVPQKIKYEIVEMTDKEKIERMKRDEMISNFSKYIATHSYKSDLGHTFDNKYKRMWIAYSKHGIAGIDNLLNEASKKANKRGKKIGRFVSNSNGKNQTKKTNAK